MVFDENDVAVTDDKFMANMLQKQFSSVYSNTNMVEPENINFVPPKS